jgi:acyl-CoA thioesterase
MSYLVIEDTGVFGGQVVAMAKVAEAHFIISPVADPERPVRHADRLSLAVERTE